MNEEWQIETILLVTSSPNIAPTWYIHLIEEELLEALQFLSNCFYFLPHISLAVSASTDGLPFVLPQVICYLSLPLDWGKMGSLGSPLGLYQETPR